MMKRWTIAVYVALIFLSGVMVGAFAHRLYTVNTVSANPLRSPEEYRKRYIAEMQSRLKLRHDQVVQLNTFLDETRARLREVHDRYRPEMDAIRHEQNGKIKAMLDQQQRAEYDKILSERERNQKKGPGPGF
jgi:Spy/CpxP family protein refolding chaperone